MNDVTAPVFAICEAAAAAQRAYAPTPGAAKAALLGSLADALTANADAICAANAKDLERGRENAMSEGLLDRLALTPERIDAIAASVREVAALPDPVGEIVDGRTLPNGLQVKRVRVPMGVLAIIYEARPNVTVDAAALALRSGNAVVLRGGSAAEASNREIVRVIGETLAAHGFDPALVATVDAYGREGANALMRARGLVDMLIPRGGAQLIQSCVENARVPVIETGVGNCHIYVDASAAEGRIVPIVLNSKTQRVGVCNAAETLLVDAHAPALLAPVLTALLEAGVTVHASPAALEAAGAAGITSPLLVPATEADYATEYLSMDIALGLVDGVQGAIEHIRRYSTGHTEAVLAQDASVIEAFTQGVDAAAIAVNASTRFTDGGQLGLGAEIGISTQKMHARGPFALRELTTVKWVITGQGHVRD